jgi:hypothetical protein
MVDLVFASVANAAALVILFSLARAIYYPSWAASAPHDALERSWGGPSAVGATLAHWLVASVIVAAMYGVILIVDRRFMEPR